MKSSQSPRARRTYIIDWQTKISCHIAITTINTTYDLSPVGSVQCNLSEITSRVRRKYIKCFNFI